MGGDKIGMHYSEVIQERMSEELYSFGIQYVLMMSNMR